MFVRLQTKRKYRRQWKKTCAAFGVTCSLFMSTIFVCNECIQTLTVYKPGTINSNIKDYWSQEFSTLSNEKGTA